MKKRSSIRGSQTPTPTPTPIDPNNLAPECIRVDKVYDWVFFANDYQNKNFIPDEACREAVSNALANGDRVTTECNSTNPEDVICNATILENGNPGRVQIIWTVTVNVSVFINGNLACTFPVRTQFDDTIMLCVPEGITNDNINCRATQVICRTDGVLMGPDMFGPMIPVRVVLCKDVQVEFPVKLEVLAKFCFPRANNIPVPNDVIKCDLNLLEFPRQCPDIFPVDNCECQATVLARNEETLATFGENGTLVPGTSTLDGEICQECSLGDSQFTFSFTSDEDGDTTPTPTASPFDLSFTYDPSTIDRVVCDTDDESLAAFGEGTQTFDTSTQFANYELRIFNDPAGFQLILRNTAGEVIFDSGVVDALVRYEECETFADLLNNND
ncbi:hypothetical protein [Pontibacillus yanchengensis]|uniref:Uncharacterized protein n=1 Tax=Pontibacillus yanchengensis Y32 TaxID=1385514 RepID=A0A0A2TT11_9BACI|nr:hypothetical protein [Pontibacillus yanchengensis]KGP72375.1 hypothetical protein N782_11985 [Pontibacillus yanchengensis Y32]